MEKHIFQSINNWRSILDNITDMITIHDKDFNIIFSNNAAKRILKLPNLYDKSIKCYESYHGTGSPPDGCPSCNCIKTGQPAVFEIFEPHLKMFLEIRAMPRTDRNGKLTALIHIVRDITESKQVEEKILCIKIN